MPLDLQRARSFVDDRWAHGIVDVLHDFIAIPNVSPAFDDAWDANGHMSAAVALVRDWCAAQPIDGMTVTVRELENRTPIVVCEIPATDPALADDTVLLYGHLDKQPEMTGWRDGLGPWTPVLDGDLLYGRGGADDGYAVFSALTAIQALREAGGTHARLLVLIEASEESGSPDLPAHLETMGDDLGQVSLVVGLDSGAATYDRLWVTTSLRGLLDLRVRVDVLTEGVHSGSAGGVVPSSFRLLRQLLDRIEDSTSGRVLVDEVHVPIPDERGRQIEETADELVREMTFPMAGTTRTDHPPVDHAAAVAAVRARTWEPAIATIAMDGFPAPDRAGNVLRTHTTSQMAIRLPPTADPAQAFDAIRSRLVANPPNGAVITVDAGAAEAGWNAPPTAPWLQTAVDQASEAVWGRSSSAMGEGGTIPFMGMLGERFPDAQFLITGVLGPGSNAHGPNEFLHLPMARGITTTVAHVLDAHATR